MISTVGPVAQTDAAFGRAAGSVFRLLPAPVKLFVLIAGLLASMVGCSVAFADHQSYVPSPNICRSQAAIDAGARPDAPGTCVPAAPVEPRR